MEGLGSQVEPFGNYEFRVNRAGCKTVSLFRLLPTRPQATRNISDEAHRKQIYRGQGWVAPVLLVNGRAGGAWSCFSTKANSKYKSGNSQNCREMKVGC